MSEVSDYLGDYSQTNIHVAQQQCRPACEAWVIIHDYKTYKTPFHEYVNTVSIHPSDVFEENI